MGNVLAGFLGGLVAYGIGHIKSIAPWKAVFLVFGALTISWAAALYFLLPDTQLNARFLSKDDQTKAVQRVQENMTGIKNNTFKLSQTLEALLDIKVWLLVIIHIAMSVANGGLQGFGSIIIKGFGFSTLNTLLIQMITGVFQFVFVLVSTIGSTYLKNARTYFMAGNLGVALIGAIMIRQLDSAHRWAKFVGFCLSIGFTANIPLTLSMSSGNVGGFTKKTTVNAMIFIGYCTGNIIGPQLFVAKEAPRYPSAFLSMIICFTIALLLSLVLRFYLIWENKRRDSAGNALETQDDNNTSGANMADRTDKQMMAFRYVY